MEPEPRPKPPTREDRVLDDLDLLDRESRVLAEEDPTGRLSVYVARTQDPLDLLALLTLWFVMVPFFDLTNERGLLYFGTWFRIVLSLIYAIDFVIRSRLAADHRRYARTHLIGLGAAVFPPLRILFSLRLIRTLFRRGNLARFLLAAVLLLLNGALLVYFAEVDVPGANIVTMGDALWWSVVTVTTVGYGDYYPVTVGGEVVATFIMVIGIVTVAVVTAQVASSFVDQASQRRADRWAVSRAPEPAGTGEVVVAAENGPDDRGSGPGDRPGGEGAATPSLADLDARLARIETMLASLVPPGEDAPGTA